MKVEVSKVDPEKYKNIESFYKLIRDQVKHENDLYNQRIIWLITIQALLYATVGLILQAAIPVEQKDSLASVYMFILLICVLGISTALIANRLLDNARNCLGQLRELWESGSVRLDGFEEMRGLFPHASGGNGSGKYNAVFRSGNLPFLFVISWILSAIILLQDAPLNLGLD